MPLLLAPFLVELSPALAEVLGEADGIIWAVFAGALLATLLISPDRPRYLRRHWFDLLLVIVPLVGLVRAARAFRLVWALGAGLRVLYGSRRLLVRRGTSFLLLGVSLVVVVAAGLIVAVERDDPHTTIHTYGDGLWWALTTIATVGYGDKYQVTAARRGLAVALMLMGSPPLACSRPNWLRSSSGSRTIWRADICSRWMRGCVASKTPCSLCNDDARGGQPRRAVATAAASAASVRRPSRAYRRQRHPRLHRNRLCLAP